ncbi:unnamed protein product [Pleuronectes platessa]|uniref:Uncharacterized protein n=1 Tax=Pleuronectes platessa TaxID=8262 RepID=A0A9N7UTP6_PLEPL|nr:unnamed protein product [Pleuronectes platessa]
MKRESSKADPYLTALVSQSADREAGTRTNHRRPQCPCGRGPGVDSQQQSPRLQKHAGRRGHRLRVCPSLTVSVCLTDPLSHCLRSSATCLRGRGPKADAGSRVGFPGAAAAEDRGLSLW